MGLAKFNVYTGEPAARGARGGPTRSRTTTVLCGVRPADGGASAARRVVGQVLPPRCTGLEGPGDRAMSDTREEPITAMNEVAGPRISRRRAAVTVIVGLALGWEP